MTPSQRIAEIEKRCDAATQGPWLPVTKHDYPAIYDSSGDEVGVVTHVGDDNSTAIFVAHSREDIPFLLDRLKRAVEVISSIAEGRGYCTDEEPWEIKQARTFLADMEKGEG